MYRLFSTCLTVRVKLPAMAGPVVRLPGVIGTRCGAADVPATRMASIARGGCFDGGTPVWSRWGAARTGSSRVTRLMKNRLDVKMSPFDLVPSPWVTLFMVGNRLDTWLELLADERRREVLRCLGDIPEGETTVDDLARRMHRSEIGNGDRGRMDRSQVVIGLHHEHLPKLEEHGFVEFDHERGTVRYTLDERMEELLDTLPEEVSPNLH